MQGIECTSFMERRDVSLRVDEVCARCEGKAVHLPSFVKDPEISGDRFGLASCSHMSLRSGAAQVVFLDRSTRGSISSKSAHTFAEIEDACIAFDAAFSHEGMDIAFAV